MAEKTNKIYISQIVGKPHLKHFNDKTTRHQVDKGGRMSAKSSKNEIKIPYLLAQDPTAEAVVVRKIYKDHRGTTFNGLKIGFERIGWKLKPKINYPAGNSSRLYMRTSQGNYIHFVGLNDYESEKGARPTKKGNEFKILWMFEITQFANEEELTNTVSNYIRGDKDWFIVLYEYNPHPKKTHWTYEWVAKMEQRSDAYVQHTNYTDLPEEQRVEFIGPLGLEEIETLKKVDYEQFKSIYLGEPANLTGTVYKKFNIDYHVKEVDRNPEAYMKHVVGVDYGETDATTFTHTATLKGYEGIRVLSQYYHKNGSSVMAWNTRQEIKGIEEYANDLLDYLEEIYLEFGKLIKVEVDSANKFFWTYLQKEKVRRRIGWFKISPTDKTPKGEKEKDSIEERIKTANLMFGGNYIEIDPACKPLIKAISESERDDNGNRKDDKTVDIDSIDSWEYSWMQDTLRIQNAILRQRGYRVIEKEEPKFI